MLFLSVLSCTQSDLLFFSFATGIEFREGSLLIDQKHNQIVKKGKVNQIVISL